MNKIIVFFLLLGSTINSFAHPSWGIIVDKNKNIYFGDISHFGRGSVWKYSNNGKLTLLIKDFHAHNVSIDSENNLVVAHGEMDQHTLIRFNSDHTIDTLFHTNNYKNFNGGCCTYTNSGEIIFSAENYFWKINENKTREKISTYKFGWNQTMYCDEDGNKYGPDIGDGLGKLVMIDQHGNASILADSLISKTEREYDKHSDILMGITKGCDKNIYIAELAGQRIIKITNDTTQTFYKSSGNWVPTGIDFFSGDAYILEYNEGNSKKGPRVIKIDESGNKTILFDLSNRIESNQFDEYQIKVKNKEKNSSSKKGSLLFYLVPLLILAVLILIAVVINKIRKKETS